jgi:dimeric dUTPase (all-alpha-NTP-PPase superfamily)
MTTVKDLTLEQLKTMLDMQNATNLIIDKDYRKKDYTYSFAGAIEAVEAMEHHGWKWWKKQQRDLPQLQMELVDIWHFILSEYLIECTCPSYFLNRSIGNPGDKIIFNSTIYEFCNMSTLDKLKVFAAKAFVDCHSVPLFFSILKDCYMTPQDLFKMYVGKNVLNKFRQDHGYKTGDYIKIWNGQEDNEHLFKFISVLDPQSKDFSKFLYEMLSKYYKNMIRSIQHEEECYINRGKS